MLAAGLRQPVVLGAPAIFGFTPLGAEPALLLQPVQCRKERARAYLERAPRNLLDAPRDTQPVIRDRATAPAESAGPACPAAVQLLPPRRLL